MADNVVLITGAYRGLGLETARQLGKKGYQVILTARKKAAGEKAVDQLKKDGIKADFVMMDVADEKSIEAAVHEVSKKVKRIDTLVNNAAVLGDSNAAVLKVNPKDFFSVLETNTIGPLLVSRAFLPLLLKSDTPRIVNVSSGAGELSSPQAWAPAYALSKTALNSITNQLANALKDKVTVTSVCPGWVRTEMGGKDAPRSVEEGAHGIAWAASEVSPELSGRFFRDCEEIPW